MNEFEDLLNSVSQVEPGDVVTAEVLTVDANQANVAIAGTGVEGVLTLRELTNDRDADINDLVKPGETLELLVLRQVVGKDRYRGLKIGLAKLVSEAVAMGYPIPPRAYQLLSLSPPTKPLYK